MDAFFTYFLYAVTAFLLGVSFLKDRRKTLLSLKRAWKLFVHVLPQFLAILLLVDLLLAAVTPAAIQRVIGAESGFTGMLVAALLGAITLVPVLVAFPVVAELLHNGAGMTQIAVFISTLNMVGFVTLPLEMKYLEKRPQCFGMCLRSCSLL
ncbi:MAG: permease [Hydrogeniiclostridium mannosilyticum]